MDVFVLYEADRNDFSAQWKTVGVSGDEDAAKQWVAEKEDDRDFERFEMRDNPQDSPFHSAAMDI